MVVAFIHDVPAQRVVFASGASARVGEEADRLGFTRALVIATPGSGARLGARLVELLGARAVDLHAQAVIHVPREVVEAGIAAARARNADGLVAAGGGSAIGLAKAIARETGLAILAVPTTYAGSEATPILGITDGERKITMRDSRVVPKTIIYDPELTMALPAAASAASGMNGIAHCVEALWIAERTPVTEAFATDALRRFSKFLPRAVADGADRKAREQCLIAAWLSGVVLCAGTALHHKLAHVLGGLGMPHAETHAIILPQVTRFNLTAAPEVRERLAQAFGVSDPAGALEKMLHGFPIPQKLRELGFDQGKIGFVASEAAKLAITVPRKAGVDDVRALLENAY